MSSFITFRILKTKVFQYLFIIVFALIAPQNALCQGSPCDSINLPYSANFTQCWYVDGGATIIDSNHAAVTRQGQNLYSSGIQSNPGETFIHWVTTREGEANYETERYTVYINNEIGVVTSWEITPYSSSDSYVMSFSNPGGRFYISIQYNGSNPVPSLRFSDIAIYQFLMNGEIESPRIAQTGDTVTFTVHTTLEDNSTPDYYSWYMYDPQGNWVDESSSACTILSNNDSNFVVIINTPGWYEIHSDFDKNNVYQSYHAYTNTTQYINIIDRPYYEQDSIYYTSSAKDTVIGCHLNLHTANLPESTRIISDKAFFSLRNLCIINLPDGLKHIGHKAFAWNLGLTSVTIPRDVQYIGDNAFWRDTNLSIINFNAQNCLTMSPTTENDGSFWPVFIRCINIHTINIGQNVTRIPDRAFWGCTGLRGTLVIPNSVSYIGHDAFSEGNYYLGDETDTLSIVLGEQVTEIGNYAFQMPFGKLRSVVSKSIVPPNISENTFYVQTGITTLTVPCNTAENYRSTTYWNRFSIIKEDCSGIEELQESNNRIRTIDGCIVVDGAKGETITIYDMMGRQVAYSYDSGTPIAVPATGIYLVRVGTNPVRKVVVRK